LATNFFAGREADRKIGIPPIRRQRFVAALKPRDNTHARERRE
jgi:hypothetical protein